MKKVLSVLLALSLLLSVSAFAASAETLTAGKDIVTYDDVVDLLPETGDNVWDCDGTQPARASGSKEEGWVLRNLSGWGANLCDTPEWSYSEGWMLYYDFEVEASSVGINLQWWNVNVSRAIALKHNVEPAGEGGDHVPEGKYVGVLDLADCVENMNSTEETGEAVKWLLNIYLVKGSVTLNQMKLIHVTGMDTAPAPTTTTKAPTTTTEAPTTTTTVADAPEADTTTTTVADAPEADTTTTVADAPATDADAPANDNTGLIIAIIVAAVVIAGGAVAVVLLLKKKA